MSTPVAPIPASASLLSRLFSLRTLLIVVVCLFAGWLKYQRMHPGVEALRAANGGVPAEQVLPRPSGRPEGTHFDHVQAQHRQAMDAALASVPQQRPAK